MRRTLFFIYLFVAFSSFPHLKIDSLERELGKHQFEDQLKVDILNQLGYEYWIVNPFQSTLYGQQAKVLAEILDYKPGLAFANRVIGVAHWARGNYDQGLEYLLNGLGQYQSLADTLGEANCLMNIGLIYSDRTNDELALKYFFDALKLFEQVGKDDRSATTYSKLATIFIRQGKFDAARDFLNRAKAIHGKNNFLYGMAEILNRYGMLKIAMKQYDSASLYLGHALEVSISIDDIDGLTKNYLDLGDVALLKNDLEKAEEWLALGLIHARTIQSHKWLKEIYERLQKIARDKGDVEQALLYYDQYVQEKDSIFNAQTLNNISRLEAELATIEQEKQLQAKEQEIVILEQKSQIQRTRFLFILICAVLIIGLLILTVRTRQSIAKRKEEKAMAEADKAKKELEFKNRELISYTVNFVQKNQLFEDLIESVSTLKKTSDHQTRQELLGIERTIKKHIQVDKDWDDFKLRFENLHSDFFNELLKLAPSLTNNDLKLCALVKMNFSIKEVADMMGISTESVKTARYRLKKKLSLPTETTINDFLNSLE